MHDLIFLFLKYMPTVLIECHLDEVSAMFLSMLYNRD